MQGRMDLSMLLGLEPDFGLRGGAGTKQPVSRLLEGTTRVLPGLLVGGFVAR